MTSEVMGWLRWAPHARNMSNSQDRILRGALLGNAGFSTLSGLGCFLAADALGPAMGVPTAALWVVGASLLPFAAALVWLATRKRVPGALALAASAADFLWVAASGFVLALVSLQPLGIALVIAVALVVALFGSLQLLGLERTVRLSGEGPRTGISASRFIAVPNPAAWAVMSNLDGYADVAPNLSFSRVLTGADRTPGLERECGDHAGGRWTETCTLWEEGRAYAFRVRTEAPDYPYPFRELQGEWSIEPEGEGTRVGMRFGASMPAGWLGDILMAAVVAPKFEKVLDELFDNWERQMLEVA